jgi:ABC-2 type transport system permease protein
MSEVENRHGFQASRRRLSALVLKETRQMVRDPGTILMGVVLPLMMLMLFGYGVSMDVHDVPIAVVVESPSPEAYEAASGLALSPFFQVHVMNSMQEAEQLMLDHKVDGILRLRGDFSRAVNLENGEAQIRVLGTDANYARIVQIYAEGALSMWAQRRSGTGSEMATGPVVIQNRLWYNDANDSHQFLVPGLVVVIMTIIGAFLTAMVVAREWEHGTFEALFVTPVRAWEILIGKTVPYFCLGMIGMVLCVLAARLMFDIPLRGSPFVLLGGSMLYLLVTLGLGLIISAITRNQFIASQLALLLSFLPAMMLSGFIFDLRSMPGGIEFVTRIVPARYFVTFVKTIFLTGDIPQVIFHSCSILALMAILLLYIAQAKTRKRLD